MTRDDRPPAPGDAAWMVACVEAEHWFARLRAQDCEADERARFREWLAARPLHEQAWADVRGRWQLLGSEAMRVRLAQDISAALTPRRPLRRLLPVAAAVVLALAGVLALGGLPGGGPDVVRYDTPFATVRTLALADGSELVLNGGSRVEVRLSRRAREVVLLEGELLLAVAADARRPFVARAGDSAVHVRGTRFMLRHEPALTQVTLLSGRVTVADAQLREPVGLTPGETLALAGGDVRRGRVDPDLVSAWSRGRLVFRATPLAEAVAEINRYVTPRLRLADEALASLPVSGSVHMADSRAIAEALVTLLPVQVRVAADGSLDLHAR